MLKKLIRKIIEKISPKLIFWIRIKKRGKYEQETDLLRYLIKPDELAIDVGANVGYFTYFILKRTNKALAFEPNPFLVSDLRRIFEKKIRIEEVALSDCSGKATLSMPVKAGFKISMLGSIEHINSPSNSENMYSIEVARKRLDDYRLEKVGFIKIDVEGHEFAVLQGGRELLKRDHPSLLIESEERHKSGAIERIKSFLSTLGYKGFFLLDDNIRSIEEFDIEKIKKELGEQ
jgi:FkbM family methyltransferase